MINLLPPTIKEEIRYSRRNAVILNYVKLSIAAIAVLAGALYGGRYYLNQEVKRTEDSIAAKQLELSRYAKLEQEAQAINNRLTSIRGIQQNQAKFSVLLADLAQFMPQGTAVSSLTLTGEDKKPVRLIVDAADYKTALGFRDSITQSPRISAADIEDIKAVTDDGNRPAYKVTVSFTFNPGQAK